MSFLNRRDFLKVTVVVASAVPLPACGSDDPKKAVSEDPLDQARVYPQGVASGDPKPDGVILWTRVEATDGSSPMVKYEVAKDEGFAEVVATGDQPAEASADNTLKLKITGLMPGTKYYYRFTAMDVRSVTGHTKTAPAADSDVPVRFAFATCQDFIGRYYHSWRALLEESPVDFVVFLGDYVYETTGDPRFQTPSETREVILPDGKPLNPTDGGGNAGGGVFAVSLEDYRTLYKTYRTDEYLREVHRLYPFIIIWDDHEFGDDCWGDHTTHYSELYGAEQEPTQRLAADRAWNEYQPAEVEYDGNAAFPNDIKIYRSFRFGKHLDLFMTDERYYRDDHVIPEGPVDVANNKFFANSAVGSRIFVVKSTFDTLESQMTPTMLGATQKQWLVSSVTGSNATWKIWGSEVQNAQFLMDFTPAFLSTLGLSTTLPAPYQAKVYLTTDQWDGYRTERAEILGALKDVSNFVVIVGDIHASYASLLHADFDAPAATPVAVEYTIAGISSGAIAPTAGNLIANDPALSAFGLQALIPHWDELLPAANSHYRYGKSDGNGVAIVDVTAAQIDVLFIHVGDPTSETYAVTGRQKFRTMAGTKDIALV